MISKDSFTVLLLFTVCKQIFCIILQISEEQILFVSEHCVSSKPEMGEISEQSLSYPPRLCYEVSHLSENDHSKLRQLIYAQGAFAVNSITPSFLISSTPRKIPTTKGNAHTYLTVQITLYVNETPISYTYTFPSHRCPLYHPLSLWR